MTVQLTPTSAPQRPFVAPTEIALGRLRPGNSIRFRTVSGSVYTFTLLEPDSLRGILEGEAFGTALAHCAGSASSSSPSSVFGQGLRSGDPALFFHIPIVDGKLAGNEWQRLRTSPVISLEVLAAS